MFQRSSLNLKCATLLGGKNCRWGINHFDLGSKSNGGKRVITSFGMSIRVFYWVHNRSGRSLIRLTPLANVPSCSFYPFPLSGDRDPHQRISRRRLPFSLQIDSQFVFPSARSLAGGPDLVESDWAKYRPHKENLQVDRPLENVIGRAVKSGACTRLVRSWLLAPSRNDERIRGYERNQLLRTSASDWSDLAL